MTWPRRLPSQKAGRLNPASRKVCWVIRPRAAALAAPTQTVTWKMTSNDDRIASLLSAVAM